MISSYTSGRLVNKFGRKLLTALGVCVFSVFTFAYTNIDTLWISLVFIFLGGAFSGVRYTASQSLTLEQVPEFRGTMMSLNAASMGLGTALGSGLGGLIVLIYGWRLLGPTLGAIGILASMIFYFLTEDPIRDRSIK
jgi:MFS family permease